MSEARLLINSQSELDFVGSAMSIGRTTENDVSFFQDSNVSRNHAKIEKRGEDEYWISDLNSSNGTTVNGRPISGNKLLQDGDIIVLGGTSEIEFILSPVEEEEETEEEDTQEKREESTQSTSQAVPAQGKGKMSLMFAFAGLAIGLAVICVFAAGLFYFTRDGVASSGCQAKATITSPENGEILKRKADIEISLENGECVQRVIYLMDGEPFAASDSEPFSATLDPSKFPDLAADGLDHRLTVVLEDQNGKKIIQPSEVALALETIRTKKDKSDETLIDINQPINRPQIDEPQESTMSLIDVKKMTTKVLPQFAGSFEYQANNQSFLRAVRKMTAEYRSEGYFDKARQYQDVIAKEFIQNRDLDPPLGYILAMSRTKFEPTNQANGAGLWKMDNQLVLENAYNGSCGSETIAAPTQKCAAIASSIYLKDIIRDVFEGDIIYGIAAFGMSKSQAAEWKATLPPKGQRGDFWNIIKDQKQREEVVRFFAAATVAENPQKFGLKKDKPLSELYKPFMQ